MKRFIAVLPFLLTGAFAQDVPRMAKDAHPSFEVANIKLADPELRSSGFQVRGHRLIVLNQNVEAMLMFAYGLQKDQIVNAPDWIHAERYTIDGYPDIEGQPSVDQYREMVQKILASRFGLAFHKEQRMLPVYFLTVGKNGPKMKPNTSSPNGLPDQTGNNNDNLKDWRFTNCTMNDIASFMRYMLNRPVVDQTNLSGKFDFTLKWTTSTAENLPADAPPDFFTAIQEQAGLKADPGKANVDVVVVEKVERPSAN